MTSLELIAPADPQRALAYFQEVLAQGYLKGREYQVLLKSGATMPVELSAALLKDAAGTPLGLIGISRDISERKRMEEALRQAEARARDLRAGLRLCLCRPHYARGARRRRMGH